jgi:DNA-directed RNA polymerase subunit H (RpoH/RPB5)
MQKYVPGEVYDNLVKLFGYRGYRHTSTPLQRQELVEILNTHEHALLKGERDATDMRPAATVRVVLIAPNSKYSARTADFKKLLRELLRGVDGAAEVVIVSELELTIHIRKALAGEREKLPNVLIENYDYNMFIVEKPNHVSVPKHTIMSQRETEEFFAQYYTQPKYMKRILASDAQAVWIGLRPGMVCKIERISETAGETTDYRFCVSG